MDQFDTGDCRRSGAGVFETEGRPRLLPDASAVLLADGIETLGLSDLNCGIVMFTELFDPGPIGSAPVDGDDPRLAVLNTSPSQEAVRSHRITLRR